MKKEEITKIEMEVIGDFVRKHEYWVNHRRSKNYIARITGLDKKFGYKREFLGKVKSGKN